MIMRYTNLRFTCLLTLLAVHSPLSCHID